MADELDDQLDYSFDVGSPDAHELNESKAEDQFSESEPEEILEERPSKRQKKDKGLSEKRQLKMLQDMKRKESLGTLEPAFIADFIISKVQRFKGNEDLSAIELQDRSVPESSIFDVTKFTEARELENMAKFCEKYEIGKRSGKDLTLVLSMSAVRVCDVARALKPVSKHGALKLINKNKIDYDKKGLSSPASLAVATPGRVRKLAAQNILNLGRIKKIMIDSSFLDVKKNAVWDLDETIPLLAELTQAGAKIYVY